MEVHVGDRSAALGGEGGIPFLIIPDQLLTCHAVAGQRQEDLPLSKLPIQKIHQLPYRTVEEMIAIQQLGGDAGGEDTGRRTCRKVERQQIDRGIGSQSGSLYHRLRKSDDILIDYRGVLQVLYGREGSRIYMVGSKGSVTCKRQQRSVQCRSRRLPGDRPLVQSGRHGATLTDIPWQTRGVESGADPPRRRVIEPVCRLCLVSTGNDGLLGTRSDGEDLSQPMSRLRQSVSKDRSAESKG